MAPWDQPSQKPPGSFSGALGGALIACQPGELPGWLPPAPCSHHLVIRPSAPRQSTACHCRPLPPAAGDRQRRDAREAWLPCTEKVALWCHPGSSSRGVGLEKGTYYGIRIAQCACFPSLLFRSQDESLCLSSSDIFGLYHSHWSPPSPLCSAAIFAPCYCLSCNLDKSSLLSPSSPHPPPSIFTHRQNGRIYRTVRIRAACRANSN